MSGRFDLFPPARSWVPAALIALLALLAYSLSFPGSFFMDDVGIVKANPLVAHLDLRAIFTTDYWGPDVNSGLYRPLTILSFALNRLLLGAEPWGFHLVNVLLHAGASLLFYAALRSLTVSAGVAWLAAGLFAVHPIHTEVVNEAVGRAELLVACFLFLGLRLAAGSGWRRWGSVAACYAAALLAKEHAVVFLVLLPACDVFFAERPWQRWRSRLPLYLALAAVLLLWLTLRVWGVDRAMVPPDVLDPLYQPMAQMATAARVWLALKLQILYLGKLLWPQSLQGIYSGDSFFGPLEGLLSGWRLAVGAFILGAGALMVHGWRRRQLTGLALALYGVSFVPTANLFFVSGVIFAERLAYLPSAWFCLGVAAFVGHCAALAERPAVWARFVWGAAIVYMLLLGGMTLRRDVDFQNPTRLWMADVTRNPRNALAWMFLADAQYKDGATADAERSYGRLLEVAPNFPDGLHAYGKFLFETGRPAEAVVYARRATLTARGMYAPAYLTTARAYLLLGRPADSLAALEKLGGMYRGYGVYWETRGKAQEAMGDLSGALESFRRERAVYFHESSDVQLRMGNLLLELDRFAEAEKILRQELARKESAAAWNALGVALVLQEKRSEAPAAFSRAASLMPDVVQYRENYERAAAQAAAGAGGSAAR